MADTGNNRIQAFSSEGEYLGQFSTGAEPYDLDVAPQSNVWVAESNEHRIAKFKPEGGEFKKVLQVGSEGSGTGQFSYPYGLGVDSEGNVWVADSFNNRVQKFDSAGNYLFQFGEEGSGNGQFSFPRGIDFAPNGDIWVSDIGNDRVQKWGG